MTTDIQNAKVRLVELCKEVLAAAPFSITDPDAQPYGNYVSEIFPYWTVRSADDTIQLDSQDFDVRSYQFVMQLTTGYVTENYDGLAEQQLDEYEPTILAYFDARRWLNTATHPTSLDNLDPRGCFISRTQFFPDPRHSGTGGQVYGLAFLIEVPFKVYVSQAY